MFRRVVLRTSQSRRGVAGYPARVAEVDVPPRVFRLPSAPGTRVVVASAGLACCAMEVESAVRRGLLVAHTGSIEPGDRCLLLVAGTVTEALGPAVRRLLVDLPAGTRVVSFGACAASGGPYWDAPTVLSGVDQLVEVDRYVPGCPPRPDDLVAALADLVGSGAA